MPRVQPVLLPLHQVPPGQLTDFFALLSERHKGSTRDGKPFYTCRFRDRRRTVSCMIWLDAGWFAACENDWHEGQIYRIRGIYGEHERYGPQIELHNLRPVSDADKAEGFNPADFVDSSRFDTAVMLSELRLLVEKEISDLPLRRLTLTLLERHAVALQRLPASYGRFHPFAGGWLEHILSVTRTCLFLVDHYRAHYPELNPPLNRDLVLAGAVLHDIGRVLELGPELESPQQTVPGRLFGHMILGRDLVRDAAREQGDLNPQLLQLLEHIIITHLTLPEWGSPRLPLIPEVLILHHADDLDAKVEMYARCLTRDTNEGPFTSRDPVLGKPLLKDRQV